MAEAEKKSQLADEKKVSTSAIRKNKSETFISLENQDTDFSDELKQAVDGLWYMSETDAEITVFAGKKADCVSKEVLAEQLEIPASTEIDEISFEEFFKNLTEIQDWFGEEEKATAEKYAQLEKLLAENLKNVTVFKVGKVEIDIYAVGLNSENKLTGISTKAVET